MVQSTARPTLTVIAICRPSVKELGRGDQGASSRWAVQRDMSVLVHRGGLTRRDLELRGNRDVGREPLQPVSFQDLYAFQVASLWGREKG